MSTFINNHNNLSSKDNNNNIDDVYKYNNKNLMSGNNSSLHNYSSQSTFKTQLNNNHHYYNHNMMHMYSSHMHNHNVSYTHSNYNMNQQSKKNSETKSVLNIQASEFIPLSQQRLQSKGKQHENVQKLNDSDTKNTKDQNDRFNHYNNINKHFVSTSLSSQVNEYFENNKSENYDNIDTEQQNYHFYEHNFDQNDDYDYNECHHNNYDDDDNVDNDYFCGPVNADVHYHHESQHCGNYNYELGPIGFPFYVEEGSSEPSPLSKLSFGNLIVNSKVWVCENNHWAFYKFDCVWDENVILMDTLGKCHLFDLNDLPLMYLQPTENDKQEQISSNESLGNTIKHVKKELNHSEYRKGRILRMDMPIVGLTSCQILTYEDKNSAATVQLADGSLFKLSLNLFEHEFEDVINNFKLKTNVHANNTTDINVVDFIDTKIKNGNNSKDCYNTVANSTITKRVKELKEKNWNYGELHTVKERTLLWRTYRNTLMGCLAIGTRDLYPVDLKYEHLIAISGLGLGFSYFDTEIDVDGQRKIFILNCC